MAGRDGTGRRVVCRPWKKYLMSYWRARRRWGVMIHEKALREEPGWLGSRVRIWGWGGRGKRYYDSTHWKKIRDDFLQRNPLCYGCGDTARTVHHEAYTYRNMSGLDEEYLYAICWKCHHAIHLKQGKRVRGSLEIARRLRARRQRMVLEGHGRVYQEATSLTTALEERLTFLIEETS